MSLFVVGNQGFLGSALCAQLTKRGLPFLGVDIKPARSTGDLQCDLTDATAVRSLPLSQDDLVVHVAARQWGDCPPRKQRQAFFDHVNVTGLANLLNKMASVSCTRLIYFSSDMVYGVPIHLPLTEHHPQQPIGEYGKSKQKAEQLCEQFRAKGMNITLFRPRLILGPGRLGVLAKLFRLIHNNKRVPLIGKGANYYQMVSVFDCVRAIELAIELGCPNLSFNLGSEHLLSTAELLSGLIKQVNSSSKLLRTNATAMITLLNCLNRFGIEPLYREQYLLADKMYYVDITHAKEKLGWSPAYNDQQMMQEAYAWFLTQGALRSNHLN